MQNSTIVAVEIYTEGDAVDIVTEALNASHVPAYVYLLNDVDSVAESIGREMVNAARAALELLENPDAEPEMADAVAAALRRVLTPVDCL